MINGTNWSKQQEEKSIIADVHYHVYSHKYHLSGNQKKTFFYI